jgi:myosin-5
MSINELVLHVKKNQALNYHTVSITYNDKNNDLRMHNGLEDVRSYDDLAEEKIKLLQDTKRLDEDVLVGLIKASIFQH